MPTAVAASGRGCIRPLHSSLGVPQHVRNHTPPRPRHGRRRSGTAAAAPALAAAAPAFAAAPAAAPSRSAGHGPAAFDEVYRGRRIQGHPSGGGHHGGHHGGHTGHGGYTVLIDGEELHVMQNADGTWISVITHYDPVPSPRAAARAAVVELQGSPLVPLATA
ncbi:tyrosinase family oxidase copper chaperone [Streptomyces sp. CC228A]|uniref:apotyrosinase chaperone MelC1 n=1 Tax=Streptomyces sp. CC228A TaxID=2898186 RepID=UPI0022A837F0|nr:tyrosinase family oxidase copper chaperone [Streptomyces sp. CC228A]